ncbi:MAG: hypothetical protein AB7R55_19175 [Gemmatimonadales bacterium]
MSRAPEQPDPAELEPLSPSSRRYLDQVLARVEQEDPAATAGRVRELVDRQVAYRSECLNLLPAENTTSWQTRLLLASGIATRVSEGFPGDKLFPPEPLNREIDEIEAIVVAQTRRLFRARWVEWRPLTNTMANVMALEAVTVPGDRLLVQSLEGGANMGYQRGAIPDLLRLEPHPLPWGPLYGIDLDRAREAARRLRPRVIAIGGGYFLFPLPVRELRSIADEVGALLLYDAAHVALFIAAGIFQDPLAEGVDFMTLGTHKVMGGPVGGIICMERADLAARVINRAHPLLLQTRDQNKLAAAAHSLTEMAAFGADYARQMVINARRLATALETEGFEVIGRERGHTETHQLVVDLGERDSGEVERRANAANLLIHRGRLPGETGRGDHYSGLRISVQEVTRQGMAEPEMAAIARLFGRAVRAGEAVESVARDAAELARSFPSVHWSFDS